MSTEKRKQELEAWIEFDHKQLTGDLKLKNIYLNTVKICLDAINNISLDIEKAKPYCHKKQITEIKNRKYWWKKQLKDAKENVKFYQSKIVNYQKDIAKQKKELHQLGN